ncbi:mechanosensitive ion channel [Geomonas sp. Red69]|uniref:Mechanosensitive ion channel n=1 Tax=Geomonas diazotrophica TaxID=2843197 RepID=A0ABX8JSF1_9BACT|nr:MULTISPECIES: mechanosensitive ion channel domain-containing protein [Geomonas]MBU5637241.1 mechanosensitive ion channel [Geomonas diazotrophica]QWV99534.1 mechanosensitive ion channel [Geomonas nitrogeniifigens]QXE88709.1 mechanosensitive ion channel [Geomonas nitrogeniifigens]
MDSLLYYLKPDEMDPFYLFWAKQALISVGIIAVFYLLSRLLQVLIAKIGTRLCAATETDLDDRILERVSGPAMLLVNCAGLYLAIRRLPLHDKVGIAAAGLLFVVNITILTVIAYRVLDELLRAYGARVAGAEVSRQIMPLVEKLCTIFLVVTALIITLKHFNYDILSLVTALGVGSLAIGLAAKDTLANMVSGFTLMIDRPFRIGDRIQLGTQVGDVIDIGLRSTKIKGADNTFLIIPNSELCNSTLVNMAFPDVRVKGRVNVGIGYGCDVERAKALMVQTALSAPAVLQEPGPEAFFMNFGDSSLNLSLFFWVADYTHTVAATDQINSALLQCFQDNGINIPYPTRTVIHEKDTNNAPQD